MKKALIFLLPILWILWGCSPRQTPSRFSSPPVEVKIFEGQKVEVGGNEFLIGIEKKKFRLSSPVVFYAAKGSKYYSLDLGEITGDRVNLDPGEFILEKDGKLHLFYGKYKTREEVQKEIKKRGEGVPVLLWEKEEKGVKVNLGGEWYQAPRMEIYPEAGLLRVGKGRYRGSLEIRESARGLEVVNRLRVEDFLKGCGMRWKDLGAEASRAMAVVLRTNALVEHSPLDPEKFGYQGVKGERADFSRAVEDTRGLVLRYRGEMEKVPFTLSCGGQTEDGGLPYLRSYRCWKRGRAVITSEIPHFSPGLSVMEALGILRVDEEDAEMPNSQLQEWLWSFSRFVSAPRFYPLEGEGKRAFLQALGKTLMDLKAGETPEPLEYLLDASIIREDDLREEGITQEDAASILYSSLVYLNAVPWKRGEIKIVQSRVTVDGKEIRSPLLFRANKEGLIPASVLLVFDGEKITFLRDASGRITALLGDGFSGAGEEVVWRKRYSLDALKARLNYFFPVGEVQDLVVKDRYPSGRVKSLEVEGESDFYLLNEDEILKFLALPSTWFVLDREYDEDGNIEGFFFIGVGRGKGLGMCLMGARRMARKGKNFRQILGAFYNMEIKGVKIGGEGKKRKRN